MKNKSSNKRILLLLIIPALIISDILLCICFYFFEPIYVDSPDLSLSDFSFELYKKYSDTTSEFYIKQISADDVVSAEIDSRLKYIDNTILITYDDSIANIDTIKQLISPFNGTVCGYINEINFIQAEFPESDYPMLQNICSTLNKNNYVLSAIVDYFEETPLSETTDYSYETKPYYYDLINYPLSLNKYDINTSSVTVGMLDVLVDSNNPYLNVANKDYYQLSSLSNPLISSFKNHGTHVAGIFGASSDSNAPAVCPDCQIISDNALNCSISYWIASIADMIVNQNVKVINMSIGYNPYITLSATLGCKKTIEFINNENILFCDVLSELINDGYEFVICTAAGNDSGSTVNKVYNRYFGYGEKRLLDRFDIFNLFTKKVKKCNAQYSLPISSITDENIKNRIIVVASCDGENTVSRYSSIGTRIDIIAPGTNIYSLSSDNDYEYMSGTSMATPFVSGTAALVFAKKPGISGEQVKYIITHSASETVSDGFYDYPLLNVTNVLEMLK